MLQELTNLGFDENAVVEGASDGSVKDISYRGTWAWALLYRDNRNLPQLWGIEAIGKDNVSKIEQTKCLDTSEIHSYRMEALGILAGLMFLRYAIEWKGKVIWHTDSQAVIDTYNGKLNHLTPGKWAVQRDKDIFDAMLYQKTWWKDRFQLEKVESHVDKKKDEYGNKRIPTPIEHMNIYADWLAESAYHQKIPIFNPRLLQRTDKWTIYKMVQGQQIELTDNWRKQIKEEIQMEITKEAARNAPDLWGYSSDEIEWRQLRKTIDVQTYRDKVQLIKIVHHRRTTNDYLHKFGFTTSPKCPVCRKETETNMHHLLYCEDKQLHDLRNLTGQKLAKKIGTLQRHTTCKRTNKIQQKLREIIKQFYTNSTEGEAIGMRDIQDQNKDWMEAWEKGAENQPRNAMEEFLSRAAEIVYKTHTTTPMWAGIITKAWMWLLRKGGISESDTREAITATRNTLLASTLAAWDIRRTHIETEEQTTTTKPLRTTTKNFLIPPDPHRQISIIDMEGIQVQDNYIVEGEKWTAIKKRKATNTATSDHIAQRIAATRYLAQQEIIPFLSNPTQPIRKTKPQRKKRKPKRKHLTAAQTTLITWRKTPTPTADTPYTEEHEDTCAECERGGTLIECAHCPLCYHKECDPDMPHNVQQPHVIYICPHCTLTPIQERKRQKTVKKLKRFAKWMQAMHDRKKKNATNETINRKRKTEQNIMELEELEIENPKKARPGTDI